MYTVYLGQKTVLNNVYKFIIENEMYDIHVRFPSYLQRLKGK